MNQNIVNYPKLQGYYQQNQAQQPNFTAGTQPVSTGNTMVQNNPILSRVTQQQEGDNPAKMLVTAAGTSAAFLALNNFINKPLQTNDYNNTLFKKIETVVDSFGSKPKVKAVTDALSKFKASAKSRINNSEILRTLFHKPSIGGSMVQSQAAGAKGHLASRALEIMKKYKSANPDFKGFDHILKKAEKESYKYYDEIINAIKTSGADLNKVMSSRPWWGFGIIKNNASLKEIINKDILIKNYKTAGKTLGQKVAGYLMRGAECVTNGLFSGKGQVVFQALMVAQAAKEASQAEKGEKFSTFMASWTELMAFLATMGVQMRVVNHLAGLKNIGMSVADVAKYQDAMKKANLAAKAFDHQTYARMTILMDSIKNAAKANTKWYQKPLKWVGQLFSFGRINETLKPLKLSKAGTFFAKIPYGLKVGLGYAGRVAFVMGVVMPLFSGIAKRISYAVFGKPVKTIEKQKAEEKAAEEEAKAEELKQQQEYAQKLAELQKKQTPPVQQPMQPGKSGNLLNQLNNKYNQPIANQPIYQQPNQVIANQPIYQQPYNPIASAPIHQSPDASIRRTYMPNPILGTENVPSVVETRSARINEVLRQADLAEMQASKFI